VSESVSEVPDGEDAAPVDDAAGAVDSRLEIGVVPVCTTTDLTNPDARALAAQLEAGHIAYARLAEVRRSDSAEVVVLDVDVDAVQHPVHDIRLEERIAVVFAAEGISRDAPEVLALREDFPGDAPHLNQRSFEYPRSICLYDVRFRDVHAQWTPSRFVALIREWFRLTARGELHAEDQPLEPLLTDGAGWIILPRSILHQALSEDADTKVGSVPLKFEARPDHVGKPVYIGSLAAATSQAAPQAVAAVLRLVPRVHGVMRHAPASLADLHVMLGAGGDDLVGLLRTSMREWDNREEVSSARMILILLVPKRRAATGPIEAVESWVFLTSDTVEGVGAKIDAWERAGSHFGVPLLVDPKHDGHDVAIELGYAMFTQSRSDLARQNGTEQDDRSIVAIGGGALGSQVMLNGARAGFGHWTIIDDDLVLPHNLARHILTGSAIGFKKADGLAIIANSLTDDDPVHRALVADLLDPHDRAVEVATALAAADLIFDLSASVTVARALVHEVVSDARRISLFLNPSGTDLTLLAEDAARTVPLDSLEMQYYRAVAKGGELQGALSQSYSRVRYGRSCRDVSVELPQPLVALHGGIGALALSQAAAAPDAQARVWRVDPSSLSITAVNLTPSGVQRCTVRGWHIVTDDALLWRLAELRAAKLPNETGGVLVGTYDLRRRIVYLVDTVPSPRDSREYPTSYMRGAESLKEDVERITAATAGQLHYIGEWHSHPERHSCHPSGPDCELFAWLTGEMAKDGLPPLMMIVGDGGLAVPYLEEIVPDRPYPGMLRPGGGRVA
jgi:hypothetical protein